MFGPTVSADSVAWTIALEKAFAAEVPTRLSALSMSALRAPTCYLTLRPISSTRSIEENTISQELILLTIEKISSEIIVAYNIKTKKLLKLYSINVFRKK